jgi:cystathionine beta-lyase/cystathionine gamma-synthase
MSRELRFETRAIHAGQEPDEATGATIVPVYQTVTYTQEAVGQHRGFEYSRSGNPTRAALEACLASLEGGRFGFAYASGMAAISGVMQLLSAGDHVVVADDLYGGSYRLFTQVMPPSASVQLRGRDCGWRIDKASRPRRACSGSSPTNPCCGWSTSPPAARSRAPRHAAGGRQHVRDAFLQNRSPRRDRPLITPSTSADTPT